MASVLSLFSGCGGFDLGFEKAGFKILAAHDLDKVAVTTYNQNLKRPAQITNLADANLVFPKSDVIIAGPPCQGFSTIGKLNSKDHRNLLLFRACNIAAILKPKIFVLENVPGLLSIRNRPFYDKAIEILTGSGFFVQPTVIECDKLGLGQRRKRLFLIARSGNRPFSINLPKLAGQTVGEVFRGVEQKRHEIPKLLSPNSPARLIAERINPGQKLCNVRAGLSSVHTWDIPEVYGHVNENEVRLLEVLLLLRRSERKRSFGDADPVELHRIENKIGNNSLDLLEALISKGYIKKVGVDYDLINTFNGTYKRLDPNSVSPTVDTQFGNARMFLHPKKHRSISFREAAAIQGFDNDYIWPLNNSAKFRLIGNAVPPPIGHELAEIVKGLMN